MIFMLSDIKVKCGDRLLLGTGETKPAMLKHGVIYDIVPSLDIPEEWSWVCASITYHDAPDNFEVILDNDAVSFSSSFRDKAAITLSYFPAEKRIFFAVEKKQDAADFAAAVHELLTFSMQLVGYRLFIDIRERS